MPNRIPLLASYGEGRSVDVNARRLINCYLEVQQSSVGTQVAAYGTPGLSEIMRPTAANDEVRALYWYDGTGISVIGNRVSRFDAGGELSQLGTLNTTTGMVSIADNGEDATSGGQQMMLVDGTDGWILDTSGADSFTQISDADFPANPETVAFLNQRFLVNQGGTGRFYGSALLDGTTWGGMDFATAEGDGDDLLAVVSYQGQLLLLGETSTEIWGDTGSKDFPFERFSNGFVNVGVVDSFTWTVAGGVLYGLTRFPNGTMALARWTGQTWQNVTPPEVLANWGINIDAARLNARLFSYSDAGHDFVVIKFQETTATDKMSWVFDTTQPPDAAWHRWSTWDTGNSEHSYHRAQVHVYDIDTNIHYVGDYENGRVYELDTDIFDDNGTDIRRDIVVGPFYGDGNRMYVREVELLMESGVGNASQANPNITLEVSGDGGHTYSSAKSADVGASSDFTQRVRWRRLGSNYSFTFRFRFADPNKFAVVGGVMEADSGA